MDFETEKIYLNQIVSQRKECFSAEENIIIPDIKPDILSTIDSCGNMYIYKKEIVNGRLKIDGGVQIYIMYLADNEQNNIRCLQTVIDFSQSIDLEDVTDDIDFDCNLNIKNIECKILNGRKVNVKVTIEAEIKLFSNQEKECVKSINNIEKIQMISDSIKINSLKGCGETVTTAKDTISVEDNLADILGSEINVKNKDIKISYNKVLSKADVMVEILYLTEDERINCVTAQIPIMGFIDIQGVSDNEICDTNYEIRNITIRPNNVEEHSIFIEIEFAIKCNAYEEKEINLIQDLYSPEEEITMNQECVNLMQNKTSITDFCNVQEKVNISEIKGNKIYNVRVSTNIIKQNILNNSISYEGELIFNILFESSITNRMEVKEQRITFTHNINSDKISKNSLINTTIEIVSKDFICMPDNTIDIRINMNFIVGLCTTNSLNIVNNIKIEKDANKTKYSSLVIYFVKEGDTLWKIAKKFKSTIEEIAKINNLDDIDKINIGEQLYIPRYVYTKIS
ncbi:MAG: DUF3794 domain-containing protein [Clostridia bacterium]|nr:DUF3794 domain-containing protein [Clostridia bacterium]